MKRASVLILLFCLALQLSWGQSNDESRTVTATGQGLGRDQALQDALRNAVAQAAGIAVQSQTQVENFVTVQDAIATHASGYITTYKVTKETPKKDEYQLTVEAVVSMKPLKADVNLLAKSIGGVRFLVTYDERNHTKEENEILDFATERLNQFLSKRKYRYVEKNRAARLRSESAQLMQEDKSQELGVAQQLAIMADAQFIIQIKNLVINETSEAFDTRTKVSVGLEVKAFDNCTGEGLGTVILNSHETTSVEDQRAKKTAVASAIDADADKLLETFATYIGNWINNGTPFELRFYNAGGFRELRSLRTSLKKDLSFGGEMEIVGAEDFQKLNCTFKKKPDELADKVLDVSDEIPDWKAKNLDVKYIYGRQISFAPKSYKIPGNIVPETEKTQPTEVVTAPPQLQVPKLSAMPSKQKKSKKR
jgi:hypothetical protein